MGPPVLGGEETEADEVGAAPALAKELYHPLVGETIDVKVVGHWVRIHAIGEVALAHGVDELRRSRLVARAPLALGEHVVDLGEPDGREVGIPKPGEVVVVGDGELDQANHGVLLAVEHCRALAVGVHVVDERHQLSRVAAVAEGLLARCRVDLVAHEEHALVLAVALILVRLLAKVLVVEL